MITRRRLVKQSAAAASFALLPGAAQSFANSSVSADEARLVVLFMRGAADALNIVVPFEERAYYEARPQLAVAKPGAEGGALDLDGQFGLHPALSGLAPFWQDRRLAFIHACGSPDPSRSHFDAQSFMETGTPGVKSTNDGWMNRLLGLLAPKTQAVAFQPTTPLILAGKTPIRTIAPTAGAGKSQLFDDPLASAAFARLYAKDDAIGKAFKEARETHDLLQPDMTEADADKKETAMADNGAPPAGGLPHTAAALAKLMRSDDTIRLAFLSAGGWDTHTGEGATKGVLANNLRKLVDSLAVLAHDLGPVYRRTVILVMTEFGRALREDGSGGTDHGHGSVMWLMGGAVAGGKVHGRWPGLDRDRLHDERDLAVTTDFRSAIGAVVRDHLGVGATGLATVFPGMPVIDDNLKGLIA